MFDCGIHEFVAEFSRQVTEKHDAMVVEEVRKVGIDIDKERLERALLDAKSFYDDGYKDGTESRRAYWDFREFDELTGITASNFCSHCGTPKGQIYDNYCGCCGCKMSNAKKGE